MPLGDGIRRNIATVDVAERNRLRDAIIALNHKFFPGGREDTPTGGVSYWFKQDEIHAATHVHGGPEFLPWHRELVNRFEQMIREVDPELSLHYWDWTTDPHPLFTPDFMGAASGDAGDPWLAEGFYVPGADPFRADSAFDPNNNPFDPPRTMTRGLPAGGPGFAPPDADIVAEANYLDMRLALEGAHNAAHGYIGGTIGDGHTAFRDPFVFLIHSNVDRLFAMWQTQPGQEWRLDPNLVYGVETPQLLAELQPWNGNPATTRPWAPPEDQQEPKTYLHPSVVAPPCYDTLPTFVEVLEVLNPGNVINFNSVPAGETAIRAAVFRIYTCEDVTLRVTSGPPAPYTVFSPADGVLHVPHQARQFVEARLWFGFTGTTPDTSEADGQVTIHCDENNQDFVFTLKADTIARETVAVMLALDQSGSMDDPAGNLGAKRIEVLRQAALRFVEIIQPDNGVGLIRFDHDAYAVNDATWPGLAVTKIGAGGALDPARGQAINAVNNHQTNPNGATSIGDGVALARNVLNAVPDADYVNKALIVFTDGLENREQWIEDVLGSINDRTYAIGLGTESQVSTAALTALTNGTGGYLLLSGFLAAGTDDYFRLTKLFLQILAGVTNNEVVTDPSGFIAPGMKLRVPFVLNEADIVVTVILLVDLPAVSLRVETPGGDVIDPVAAAGFGGVYVEGANTSYYRLTLPVPVGASGSHAGTWHALLELDEQVFKRLLARLDNDRAAFARAATHGVRFSVNVHAFSNLRLRARLDQTSMEPGATLSLRAVLTEYGVPVEGRASARAELERPDGTRATLALAETEPGVFEAATPASMQGVYRFRLLASGATMRRRPFTREQLLTGAVLRGGDGPFPKGGNNPREPDEPDAARDCCSRLIWLLWVGLALLVIIILILLLRR
jgi:hypothetical protein